MAKKRGSIMKVDPFYHLGRDAPIFRAMLGGVEFPVASYKELLKQIGGENRVLRIADSSKLTKQLYCVKDIFDAIPKFYDSFPFKSLEEMIVLIAEIEKKTINSRCPKLTARITHSRLKVILNKPKFNTKENKYSEYAPIWDPLFCGNTRIVDIPLLTQMLLTDPFHPPYCLCIFRKAYDESNTQTANAKGKLDDCKASFEQMCKYIEPYLEDRDSVTITNIESRKRDALEEAAAAIVHAQKAIWAANTCIMHVSYVYTNEGDEGDLFTGASFPEDGNPNCQHTKSAAEGGGNVEYSGPISSYVRDIHDEVINTDPDPENHVELTPKNEAGFWKDPREYLEQARLIWRKTNALWEQINNMDMIPKVRVCVDLTTHDGNVPQYNNIDISIYNNSDIIIDCDECNDPDLVNANIRCNFTDEKTLSFNDETGYYEVDGYYGNSEVIITVTRTTEVDCSSYPQDDDTPANDCPYWDRETLPNPPFILYIDADNLECIPLVIN